MKNAFILPDNFTITAHTGCEGTKGNSVESVVKSYECGADVFEVDVRFDSNGVPVLSHDEPAGGEMTLEDAFEMLAEYKNMRCNIDIKSTDNMKAIPELAKKYGVLDRIFYTGINADFVEAAKSTPEIPYYLNATVAVKFMQTSRYLDLLVEKIKNSGAVGLNCNYKNVTKKLVNKLHKNGILVSVWTCDSKRKIIKMLKVSPDNITSRNPTLVKRILQKDKIS